MRSHLIHRKETPLKRVKIDILGGLYLFAFLSRVYQFDPTLSVYVSSHQESV